MKERSVFIGLNFRLINDYVACDCFDAATIRFYPDGGHISPTTPSYGKPMKTELEVMDDEKTEKDSNP
jgi:hypothetical protein